MINDDNNYSENQDKYYIKLELRASTIVLALLGYVSLMLINGVDTYIGYLLTRFKLSRV